MAQAKPDPSSFARLPARDAPILLSFRLRALSFATLLWERLVPRLWLLATPVALYLMLAWVGLLTALPAGVHLAVLVVLALGQLAAGYVALRGLAWPQQGEVLRRLERDSGLQHRPLSSLMDRPIAADPAALALWQVHRQRLLAKITALRVSGPVSEIAGHDPLGLRALLVLGLVITAVVGLPRLGERTVAGLLPNVYGFSGPPPVLDLWITPPSYTGLPPKALSAMVQTEPPTIVSVPVGSRLLARVAGLGDAPDLVLEGQTDQPFVPSGIVDAWQIETTITAGSAVAVQAGRHELGRWPIAVIADQPPTISFAQPPMPTARGALRLDYQANDDYGLASVEARIALKDGQAEIGSPPLLSLPLPGGSPAKAQETSFHDLTAHPWAGLEVTLRLHVTDVTGQTGQSDEQTLLLPERTFTHPLARVLINQRRDLVQQGEARRRDVGRQIGVMTNVPAMYDNDVTVFLSLRTLAARLLASKEANAIDTAVEQLWETALYLEEGRLSAAERRMRELQRELSEALADPNTSDDRIAELMDELRQAMADYLAEMMQQAQNAEDPTAEIDPNAQMMTPEDLARMLDRMQQMAQSGARDAARDMLAELQDLLENLRAGRMSQQGEQGPGGRMMQDLRNMAEQQQRLMDQSFRRSQGMGEPGQGEAMARMQQMLRDRLGQMMERLGEMGAPIPGGLGDAELRMRAAEQALRQGNDRAAAQAQAQALQGLRDGTQALMDQMAQQGQGEGEGQGQPGQQRQGRQQARDPLGRTPPGMGADEGNDVVVPTESDMQRARRILDELRRRSAEPARPPIERDYIDRLLRRF